jgi:hypothetical protein
MTNLRTDKIRQKLNELGEMIDAMFGDEPIKAALEKVCPYCGASVDRDIDGQYECGTAWGSKHDDRAADCLRAELEDLRSKPIASDKISALMKMLNECIESVAGRCVSDEYYAGKWNALCGVRFFVKRLFNESEATNNS